MAITSGSTLTYDVGTGGGNREDLEDVIWDLFVEETYCLSNFDRTGVDAVTHEWLKDSLEAAAANTDLEGNAATFVTLSPPTRLSNPCQISSKTFLVSRTQERVNKAGRTSEIQRNAMKKLRELKNDIEFAIVRNQGGVTGSDETTTRQSAGMESWIATNVTYGTTTVTATHGAFQSGPQSASTSGVSLGTLTETIFASALELAWNQGGDPRVILTNARQKSLINNFGALAQKNIDLNNGSTNQFTIVAASDAYVSLMIH